MTVTSDSEVLDGVPALLTDWLHVVTDAGACALVILGPSVTDDAGKREVIVSQATRPMGSLLAGALALAASNDFLAWDGPLVVWQSIVRGAASAHEDGDAGPLSWRSHFFDDGLVSFVRVAMELPGGKCFEIYTLTDQPIRNRAEAAPYVLAAMGSWPDVRRKLVASRLKLSNREAEALRLVLAGHSAPTIADMMGITERTAKYYVNTLAEKFRTKGRYFLPMRAAWLGLLD